MKFSLLLFILFQKLKKAVKSDKAYRSYIGEIQLKILMKTADGKRGRLFIFDKGKLSSRSGAGHAADAALVWSDAATAFKVMASGSDDIPIVCIVNNDCAWGMIKHSQELSIGKDRLVCAELGIRHYEKMVEGLGGYGEFVTKDEEIIPAVKRAFESGKPACVNMMTDPSVTSPMTPLFCQSLKME